jgi:hypothetical protein
MNLALGQRMLTEEVIASAFQSLVSLIQACLERKQANNVMRVMEAKECFTSLWSQPSASLKILLRILLDVHMI